jgi:hypothetical protein
MHIVIEGKRLDIKDIYFYAISGVLEAISVAFHLFLAEREIHSRKW